MWLTSLRACVLVLCPNSMLNHRIHAPRSIRHTTLWQATLEALGFICEDLGAHDPDCLQQIEVDQVLTAVVQGIRKEEPDPEVSHTPERFGQRAS
jgi:hypothetical protein